MAALIPAPHTDRQPNIEPIRTVIRLSGCWYTQDIASRNQNAHAKGPKLIGKISLTFQLI